MVSTLLMSAAPHQLGARIDRVAVHNHKVMITSVYSNPCTWLIGICTFSMTPVLLLAWKQPPLCGTRPSGILRLNLSSRVQQAS